MFTFKNWKEVLQFVMWNYFPCFFFLTYIFYNFPFFIPGKQPYFEISKIDFANAFLSPGVNSRAELVPSPRACAWNGAPRPWLGDNNGVWRYMYITGVIRIDEQLSFILHRCVLVGYLHYSSSQVYNFPKLKVTNSIFSKTNNKIVEKLFTAKQHIRFKG
jgi:hypothetical protein